jgi:hypothetical protein
MGVAAVPAADRELRASEAAQDSAERWWAATWATVLAMLLVFAAVADCARAEIQVDEEGALIVLGDLITESVDGGVVTQDIRNTHEDAVVHGTITRNVRIQGDVETRASGAHSSACTSIGSIGGCADREESRLSRKRSE